MSFTREDDLSLALDLAQIADRITSARFLATDLAIDTKPDKTPVTDADKAAEEALRAALNEKRPRDGIVGEEFGENGQSAERYWVIDPIDGTANFLRGVPIWATLIGLIERSSDGSEKVVVGVVSAPALMRRWYAAENKGAFVSINSGQPKRISVSQVSQLTDASISYSNFPHADAWGDRFDKFQSLLVQSWRTRAIGDFYSHLLVAEGAVDVAAEPKLALWDMAALDIIVREAGGRFTNLEGREGPFGGNGLSTNSVIHSKIIKELN